MTILERVLKLLDERHITDTALCDYIGIKSGQFSTWKARKTEPPAKYISKIAEFFSLSDHYILTGEKDKTYLTTEEWRLLNAFRNMNYIGQGVYLNTLEVASKDPMFRKDQKSSEHIGVEKDA